MKRAHQVSLMGIIMATAIAWASFCYGEQSNKTVLDDRLRLPEEKLVFSFRTENGKVLSVCTSETPSYIVYRFGTKDEVELEYPTNKDDSWNKFAFYVYARGGYVPDNGPGKPSSAVFLVYLMFINEGFEYTIFDEWNSWGDKRSIGLRINDDTPAPGEYPTPKIMPGSLVNNLRELMGSKCEISYWDVNKWRKNQRFEYKH